MEQQISKQGSEISPRYIADNEINLVDLFLILWKRRVMIITLTLLLTFVAVGISLIMPKVYQVTAILESGRDVKGKVVVKPQAIRENILGGTYDQMVAKKLGLPLSKLPQFKVATPKKTDLVKISVESSKPQQAVKILHELLVGISGDIQERLDIEIKKIKNEIKKAQIKDGFLLEKITIVKEQIIQIRQKMTVLEQERKTALAATKDDAMAILLYSNEIQNQEIYFGLQEKLANILNQKSQMALKIDDIKLKLTGIKGTNINKPPSVSDKPIKPKKTLIVVLAFMLGLMGSIMVAFFAEFMIKVRQQQ